LIGLKPLEPHLQNLLRESFVPPQVQVANAQTPLPTNFQTVTDLAAHPRPHFRSAQSGNSGRTNCNMELPAVQPMTGNAIVGPGSFFSRCLFDSLFCLWCFYIVEKLMLLYSCS